MRMLVSGSLMILMSSQGVITREYRFQTMEQKELLSTTEQAFAQHKSSVCSQGQHLPRLTERHIQSGPSRSIYQYSRTTHCHPPQLLPLGFCPLPHLHVSSHTTPAAMQCRSSQGHPKSQLFPKSISSYLVSKAMTLGYLSSILLFLLVLHVLLSKHFTCICPQFLKARAQY